MTVWVRKKLCLIDIFCATVDVEQWVPLSIFSMGRVQVALAACVLYLLYAILFEWLNSSGGIHLPSNMSRAKQKILSHQITVGAFKSLRRTVKTNFQSIYFDCIFLDLFIYFYIFFNQWVSLLCADLRFLV